MNVNVNKFTFLANIPNTESDQMVIQQQRNEVTVNTVFVLQFNNLEHCDRSLR